MSGLGFIAAERPQQCDQCGAIRELRPYGPGGSAVCHTCLELHPAWWQEAGFRMKMVIFGDPLPQRYRR